MSNWYTEENTLKHLDVNHQINQLISEDLIKGYQLDEVWLTTFSLDYDQLELLLEDIGATTLIGDDKVHVFYDGYTQSPLDESNMIISDKCLYHVKLDNNGKLYAFHPKVMLLRYVNANKCRYVILILSKNISKANLLDVFSLAYADVGDNIGKNSVTVDEKANGGQIAEFWKNVYEKSLGKNCNIPEQIEQLNNLSFHQENDGLVSFLNASEVLDKLKDKEDLIIVSPFLSDETISKINGNIKLLFSNKISFAGLTQNNIDNLIEKCLYLSENMGLHAKIYVWKENDKTCWIVGSSNFTNNGCDLYRCNGNIEYNMYFETEEKEYGEFQALLHSVGTTFSLVDYNVLQYEAKRQTFNPRQIFYDFCNRIEVEVAYVKKEYNCTIKISDNINEEIRIIFHDGTSVKISDINDSGYPFHCAQIIPSFNVCISDEEGNSRQFRYSLYELWKDKQLNGEIDEMRKRAYLDYLEVLQNRIGGGGSQRKIGEKSGNNNAKGNKRMPTEKLYIYEQLMKMSMKFSDKEQFERELERMRKYNEAILKINPKDIKQQKIQEILEKYK